MKKVDYYIVALLLISIVLFFGDYIANFAALSDDITILNSFKDNQSGLSGNEIISKEMQDPNTFSRPLNAVVKPSLAIASFQSWNIYLYASLLFCFTLVLVFWIGKKLQIDQKILLLVLVLCFFFPFSVSTILSATMVVSSIPIILYLISVLLLLQERKFTTILAILLLFTSTLIYEINLFVLPMLVLLVFHQQKNIKKSILPSIFIIGMPFFSAILYKKIIAKSIHSTYADYTDSKFLVNLSNGTDAVLSFVKTYGLDVFLNMKRSIISLPFFSILDVVLLCIMLIISVLVSLELKNISTQITKKNILYALFFVALSHAMFFVSIYKVNTFGFEDRTLGWARISMSVLVLVLVVFAYQNMKQKFAKISIQVVFFFMLLSASVQLIARKNAWIFAGNLNHNMITAFQKSLPKKLESKTFLFEYNKYQYPEIIADEPSFKSDYEYAGYLYHQFGIKDFSVYTFSRKDYFLDYIFAKKINNRPKTDFQFIQNGIRIKKRNISYPFYVYNYDQNSLILIQHKEAFQQYTVN